MCDCKYPFNTVVVDRTVSYKPKKNGLVTVDRFTDCIFHGPQCERVELIPQYENGHLVRQKCFPPCRLTGTNLRRV